MTQGTYGARSAVTQRLPRRTDVTDQRRSNVTPITQARGISMLLFTFRGGQKRDPGAEISEDDRVVTTSCRIQGSGLVAAEKSQSIPTP